MSDVNANIKVSIDSSQALSELKSLQRQISLFHNSIAKSSAQAALAQKTLQTDLLNAINATGRFSAEMRTIKTSTEAFTNSLEKNKFSIRQYFRYAGASTKTFGKLFRSEFDTISQVAEDRVKKMQTQYIKMGRDARGTMQAIAVTPKSLNLSDFQTQLQITAQRQQLFNQLLKQGSTNLLNFGKNTQWAGRQLMVGFTLPLAALGATAAKTFMDMETAAIKFRKVYGDLFTPAEERERALGNIQELGGMFTRYGIAVSETVTLASEAAAAGFQGLDLQRQVTEATRLQVLGQVDQQKALETTISLQNAFRMSNEELTESINFLNAVENQTVVSLDDITTAIPKVAPVIQQLGGNLKDLAFFMAAMKEGGINASEGANALKSGLASLINPTEKASDMLATMGINIKQIIESNKGNLRATVIEFAKALDTLDPLARARAIEQLFGEFQFARLSTLFDNVTRSGNQATRVLELSNASIEELASTAEKELGMTAESSMVKFRKAVEDLKVALVPVGQAFLEALTPILESVSGILEKFKDMSSGTKRAITILVTVIGGLGPVLLMTFGLLANGLANILKLFGMLRGGYLRLGSQSKILGEQTQYLTSEEIEAAAIASSLDQAHSRLIQTFNVETETLNKLKMAYLQANNAASRFAMNNPGMMFQGKVNGYAKGGKVFMVPGSGNKDTVPAMLTPGEIVVPKKQSEKYGPLIQGIIADNIPGFAKGGGIGDIKKQVGLYKAPSAILAQTGPMNWETLSAEINAVTNAVRNLGLTQNQVFNLTRKQASHIAEDIRMIQVGNKSVAVKNWKAENLVADMGYINNYVDTLRKNSTILENFRKTHLDVTAKDLGMSMTELNAELDRLKSGLHPVTRTSASVLQRVALSDPGYQGVAAAAGLQARLSGNFYETTGQRRYSPAFDVASAKNVDRKIIKMQQLAGQQMANASINAIQASAQTASPSKRTIPIGEDIARGLEVGMNNRTNAIRQSGRTLVGAATGGMNSEMAMRSRITTYGTTGPVDPISKSIRRQNEKRLSDLQQSIARPKSFITENMGSSVTKNLQQMNGALRGTSFALMSVGAAGSFAGGKLGEVSQKIMTYSGLLFGLMTVTELLTQQSTLLFLSRRKELAAGAVAGAVGRGGIFAKAGPLGGLARAGLFITKFLGPIGLATTAIAGLYATTKIINNARERERLAIEGLGDAATLTKDKLDTLGNYFGVAAMETPFEATGPRIRVSGAQRAEVEKLKGTEDFKKTFAKDIKSLTNATAAEAQNVFNSLAIQLLGKGYAKEQINTIIQALQEESKQTSIRFEFSNIDLTTAGGMNQLRKTVNSMSQDLGREFSEGYTAATYDGVFIKTRETLSKDLQKSINTTSKAMIGMFNGISGQFANGIIDSKQFAESFDIISNRINAMPEPQAMMLMSAIMKGLPEDLQKGAEGIKSIADRLLLVKAQTLGVAAGAQLLNALTILSDKNASPFAKLGAAKQREAFIKQIEEAMKLTEDLIKKQGTITGKDTEKGEKNALQLLKERTKELRTQTEVFRELRKAGIDYATAQEMAANADLAKLIQQTGYVGENWQEAVRAIKQYEKAQKDLEKNVSVGGGVGDYQKYLFERAEKFIQLQEHLIDMQYKGQLKSIEDQLKGLDAQLDAAKKQENLINEKFDKQISALNTIKTLNDAIAAQEKQRLTIADALSRGDISAAAVAIQEARSQQAAASMEAAQQGLAAGRDQAIAAVGAKKIQDQIDALNEQKKVIEDTIEKQKESISYFGMTADQIRDAAKALDLANDAGIDINNPTFLNNLLKAATGDGTALKAVMVSLQEEARKLFAELEALRASFLSTKGATSVTPIVDNTPLTYSAKAAGFTSNAAYRDWRQNERMYGGMIKKYAMGGSVTGFGMTDTVPTLLTPGEYVINRNAAKKFGPLLQSINESKYPGSLSFGGGSPMIAGISNKSVNNNTAVYNYSLNVNAGSSANPDDIARTVIAQIRSLDSQRLRGNRY